LDQVLHTKEEINPLIRGWKIKEIKIPHYGTSLKPTVAYVHIHYIYQPLETTVFPDILIVAQVVSGASAQT